MGKKQKERVSELSRRVEWLESRIELLAREVHSPDTTIRTLLDGIAPLVVGYQREPEKTNPMEQIAMGSLGFNERAGVTDGTWFPDVEFDISMEDPSRWPQPGHLNPIQQPHPTTLNGSYRIENGHAVRNDGEPMFRVGETAPPPDSATE
jgi:hypothetical protein